MASEAAMRAIRAIFDLGVARPLERLADIIDREMGNNRRVEYKKAALTGIVASIHSGSLRRDDVAFGNVGRWAGEYANAMIAEDEQHEKEGP